MADYVVRLTGQDNLSGTIKNVKSAVADLGNSASTNLSKFADKFQRIEQSTAPLKKQLRDLKALMAEMNFKGLSGTEEFTKIAAYAGKVKDAIADAGTAVTKFADDTFALKAATEGVKGIAAAASIATGAMGLLGVENDKVKDAILRVQSAMAILNGVQQVANILNKDSVLMLKLKDLAMKANTTNTATNTIAETANTAATSANTVSEAANTAALTANTIAQKAWNVAKAVGKALIGDFTGLMILGAAAVVGVTSAIVENTSAQEDNTKAMGSSNDATDKATQLAQTRQKVEQEMASTIASSVSKQLTNYTYLQRKWNECGNDVKQQRQFLVEYRTELDNTGFAVRNVYDAHNLLVKQGSKVIDMYFKLAEAAAAAAVAEEAFKRKIERQANPTRQNGGYYTNYKAGQQFKGNGIAGAPQEFKNAGLQQGRDYTGVRGSWNSWALTPEGAARLTANSKQNAQKKWNEANAADNKVIDVALNIKLNAEKGAKDIQSSIGLTPSGKGGRSTGGSRGGRSTGGSSTSAKGGSTTSTKNDFEKDSKEYYKQQISDIDKTLSKTKELKLTQEKVTELVGKKTAYLEKIAEIEKKEQDALNQQKLTETKNAATQNTSFKTMEEKQQMVDDINDLYNSGLIPISEENKALAYQASLIKQIEQEKKGREAKQWIMQNGITPQLSTTNLPSDLKGATNPEDALLNYYNSAMQVLSDIQEKYSAGIINKEQFLNEWEVIEELLKEKGLTVTVHPEIQQSEWEIALNNAADTLNTLGSTMSQLGQAAKDDALNVAGTIAQAIANVWLGYSKASEQAATMGPWAWVGFSVGALAQVVGIVSQIKSSGAFANGGIVGGSSYSGDRLIARVNSGEMILNGRQQKNLFNAIDSNRLGADNAQSISFKIKGSDLYGTLKNYSKIKGKSGVTTGIK